MLKRKIGFSGLNKRYQSEVQQEDGIPLSQTGIEF